MVAHCVWVWVGGHSILTPWPSTQPSIVSTETKTHLYPINPIGVQNSRFKYSRDYEYLYPDTLGGCLLGPWSRPGQYLIGSAYE